MKPNRTFIYLALAMVFLLATGICVVLLQTGDLLDGMVEPSLYMTASAIMATNSEVAVLLAQTATSATATFTPIPAPVSQCAYSWARRDLPDVTALAQAALDTAHITDTTIRAEAYGEECIDQITNIPQRFGAMTTDFYLTISAVDAH